MPITGANICKYQFLLIPYNNSIFVIEISIQVHIYLALALFPSIHLFKKYFLSPLSTRQIQFLIPNFPFQHFLFTISPFIQGLGYLTSGEAEKYKESQQNQLFGFEMLEHVNKQSLFENTDENKDMQESNWDNDFVLQLGLIPKTLIKIKTAKNILFIGRCVRVIQASQGVLGPVCKRVSTAQLFQINCLYDSFQVVYIRNLISKSK